MDMSAETLMDCRINRDSKCRISKEANETASYKLNICPKLTSNKYVKGHSNAAAILHLNICQHYGIKTDRKITQSP